jgi:hypothetical protein
VIQIFSIILFFLLPLFTHPVYASVVINEAYPKTDPSTQEWIELYNNGTEEVSLNQWKLQNTNGDVKSFILNASWIIAPKSFLTFTGAQTGISFSLSGDSVQLFDGNNSKVDSQSFPSILGYNNSMGRSTDGGGTWALCTTSTYNLPNNCPQPTPTVTPIPTNTPIPTTTPLPTETPIPTVTPAPTQQVVGSLIPSSAVNDIPKVSPTPASDSGYPLSKTQVFYASLLMFVFIGWGAIAGIAYLRKKEKNNTDEENYQ